MIEPVEHFARRIFELRRERKWSQPQLGKQIGTSGAIIGRYERAEMTPSIEVAWKMAQAFGVPLDSLFSAEELPSPLRNPEMLSRWMDLDGLPAQEQERICFVVDALIRDARARQAYRGRSLQA